MFNTMDELIEANTSAGYHFFDAETKAFFNSKVHMAAYPIEDGALFVTSEKFTSLALPDGKRRYTIRIACSTPGPYFGRVLTFGEFQEYTSLAAARRVIEDHRDHGATFAQYYNQRYGAQE